VAGRGAGGFILGVSVWLWFTVLFANFASHAEGAARRRPTRCARPGANVFAKKLEDPASAWILAVPASTLRKGDFVVVAAGDVSPATPR